MGGPGPGGRERRRDPRRKDRSEEMADVLVAARDAFAPLASAFGDMVRSIAEGLRPPASPAPAAPLAMEPEPVPVLGPAEEPAPKRRRRKPAAKADPAAARKKKAPRVEPAKRRKPAARAAKKGTRAKS